MLILFGHLLYSYIYNNEGNHDGTVREGPTGTGQQTFSGNHADAIMRTHTTIPRQLTRDSVEVSPEVIHALSRPAHRNKNHSTCTAHAHAHARNAHARTCTCTCMYTAIHTYENARTCIFPSLFLWQSQHFLAANKYNVKVCITKDTNIYQTLIYDCRGFFVLLIY